MLSDVTDRAFRHIRACDDIFDGNSGRPDKEFAYYSMRQLAMELIDGLEPSGGLGDAFQAIGKTAIVRIDKSRRFI